MDYKGLITDFYYQIGYEIEREAIARATESLEDRTEAVGNPETRLRSGNEIRPSGRIQGAGESVLGESELGEIDSPHIHFRLRSSLTSPRSGIGRRLFYRGRDCKPYLSMVKPTGETMPDYDE